MTRITGNSLNVAFFHFLRYSVNQHSLVDIASVRRRRESF
ncbi:hypothetical protein LEP1GSC058_2999 [Leptospira fainei serovar Hurstbridge str. BUT 6]|uniref:Uncharacterized protein n=1 Tax=Leptospira fainei serovar Hurstbridge str. BUT 6 TaxID=1193011 RepID=S3VY73_9LEPT|nr:hypothetical protein LEP1GSC058_2999 [Leptospira fainei serovar Hurstbridge str. BUT 6]